MTTMTSSGDRERGERLRAGHDDRELVVARLRAALDEGRITLSEYDERLAIAYQALTYADLNTLLADIPTSGGVLEIRPMKEPAGQKPNVAERQVAARAAKREPARSSHDRRMPLALMILWTIWGSVVGINIAVWLLVCILNTEFIYPWPLWVAGPSGAALLGTTLGVQAIRRRRRQDYES